MSRRRILPLTLVLVLVGLLGPALTYWLLATDQSVVFAFNPVVVVFAFGLLLVLGLFGRVMRAVLSAET